MPVPRWQKVPIVSGRTAERLLDAPDGPLTVSLDLGRTASTVQVHGERLFLPRGEHVPRAELRDAFSEPEDCVRLDQGRCRKVYHYDQTKCSYYKLFQPFQDMAPTIVINGMTMHAIVRTDPWSDVRDKVACVPEQAGECLDTCCGLGYSAQLLAAVYDRVVTTEADANVLDVASVNPWSEGLFHTPNVEVRLQDVRYLLAEAEQERFACIFHDPPTVHLAGELYSEVLYRRFRQVLRWGGFLYHYVGAPGGRRGGDYTRGVMRRLQEAGFRDVKRTVGGVCARKPEGRV